MSIYDNFMNFNTGFSGFGMFNWALPFNNDSQNTSFPDVFSWFPTFNWNIKASNNNSCWDNFSYDSSNTSLAPKTPTFDVDTSFSKSYSNYVFDDFSWQGDTFTRSMPSSDLSTSFNNFSYMTSSVHKSSSTKRFNLANYDAKAGKRLAQTAIRDSVGFKGKCATYVKRAIQKSGLGEYVQGHAYQMTDILRQNKNFQEISPTEVNIDDLPAGCVLVYNKGSQGYSKRYGHTQIITEDGRGVSDGITKGLCKPPDAIFMPVLA